MRTIVANIGEFFTGDIAAPMAPVRALLIEDGIIAALDPRPRHGVRVRARRPRAAR